MTERVQARVEFPFRRHLVIVAPADALGLIEGLAAADPSQFEAVHERHRSYFAHDSPHYPHHHSHV